MAAANRNLEEEFDTLKAGLETLRKDISSLVSSFGDTASDEVTTRAESPVQVRGCAPSPP